MSQSELIELLDRLRYSAKSSERNQALKDLKLMEAEGSISDEELLALLFDNDFVFKTYAIGALGRLKIEKAIKPLCDLYNTTLDPMVLTALVNTFIAYENNSFLDCVEKKLQQLLDQEEEANSNVSFLLEQLVVPSLKYFQIAGESRIASTIERFLNDAEPTIRWHALLTFDKLNIYIADEKLKNLAENDTYALVREQASIMLTKKAQQNEST